jgi:hypothetical protein
MVGVQKSAGRGHSRQGCRLTVWQWCLFENRTRKWSYMLLTNRHEFCGVRHSGRLLWSVTGRVKQRVHFTITERWHGLQTVSSEFLKLFAHKNRYKRTLGCFRRLSSRWPQEQLNLVSCWAKLNPQNSTGKGFRPRCADRYRQVTGWRGS